MRKAMPWLFVAIVGVVALTLAGCPSKEPADTGGPPPVTGGDPGTPTPAEPGPEPEPGTAALTKDSVKNFMASMEDEAIEEVMDELGEKFEGEDEDDPEMIKQALDAAAENAALDEAVKAHGFSGAEEWVGTAKKVFPGLAYAMAVVMGEMMEVEEGSDEFNEMMEDSEFGDMEGVFDAPNDEEKQIIVDAVREMMEAEMDKQTSGEE